MRPRIPVPPPDHAATDPARAAPPVLKAAPPVRAAAMSALGFDDAALEGLALELRAASDIDTALLSDIDGADRTGTGTGRGGGAGAARGNGARSRCCRLGAIPAGGAVRCGAGAVSGPPVRGRCGVAGGGARSDGARSVQNRSGGPRARCALGKAVARSGELSAWRGAGGGGGARFWGAVCVGGGRTPGAVGFGPGTAPLPQRSAVCRRQPRPAVTSPPGLLSVVPPGFPRAVGRGVGEGRHRARCSAGRPRLPSPRYPPAPQLPAAVGLSGPLGAVAASWGGSAGWGRCRLDAAVPAIGPRSPV